MRAVPVLVGLMLVAAVVLVCVLVFRGRGEVAVLGDSGGKDTRAVNEILPQFLQYSDISEAPIRALSKVLSQHGN